MVKGKAKLGKMLDEFVFDISVYDKNDFKVVDKMRKVTFEEFVRKYL